MAAAKKYLRCGCPACGNVITYPDYSAGGTSVCDRCGKSVHLPGATAPSAPSTAPSAAMPAPKPSAPAPPRPSPPPAAKPTKPARRGFLRFVLWTMNLAVLGAVTIAVLKRAKPDPSETGTPGEATPTSLPGPPSATPPPAPAPAPQVMTNVITVTNVVTLTNRPAPTPRPATNSAVPPAMTTNTAPVPATPTNTPPPSAQSTNGLAVLGLSIERPRGGKGSRLTYVTGVLQNETDRKRFGVRVDLNLLDRSRQLVGMATDYTPVIEPKDTWRFRALVLDARAVTASVATIKEDQ